MSDGLYGSQRLNGSLGCVHVVSFQDKNAAEPEGDGTSEGKLTSGESEASRLHSARESRLSATIEVIDTDEHASIHSTKNETENNDNGSEVKDKSEVVVRVKVEGGRERAKSEVVGSQEKVKLVGSYEKAKSEIVGSKEKLKLAESYERAKSEVVGSQEKVKLVGSHETAKSDVLGIEEKVKPVGSHETAKSEVLESQKKVKLVGSQEKAKNESGGKNKKTEETDEQK